MSNMLHEYDDDNINENEAKTFKRFMASDLDFHLNYEEGKKVMAIQYVGMPYEKI
jgi:p-hydroxybenzoate 3-monooxygenase